MACSTRVANSYCYIASTCTTPPPTPTTLPPSSAIVLHGAFFFSSRRRHTRFDCDWSSDVCSSDLRCALVGVLGDKDYLGMIDCLAREVDRFIFTIPDSAPERRRWDLGRLERELGGRSEERRVGKEGRSRWSPYH